MAAAFPIAVQLLTEELDRLARDHYSDGPSTCDGCQRAYRIVQEIKALRAAAKAARQEA